MCIQGLKGAAAPIITTRLRALGITHHTQIPMQPAAPSPIHIRYREHPALPTVCLPITPCRTSCASHDVGERVVRWQGGRFSGRSIQRVRVGLRSTGVAGVICSTFGVITRLYSYVSKIITISHGHRMPMFSDLRFRQGGLAHSAGQTFSTTAMRQKNKEIQHGKSHRCPC